MKGVLIVLCILSFLVLAPSCPNGTPEYFFSEGEGQYEKKNYKDAIRYYSLAIKKNPDYYNAFYKRAICKVEIDSLKSAVKDFDVVVSYTPTGDCYYRRANAKWKLKDSIGACSDWVNACDLLHNKSCDVLRLYCR